MRKKLAIKRRLIVDCNANWDVTFETQLDTSAVIEIQRYMMSYLKAFHIIWMHLCDVFSTNNSWQNSGTQRISDVWRFSRDPIRKDLRYESVKLSGYVRSISLFIDSLVFIINYAKCKSIAYYAICCCGFPLFY